MAMVEELMRCSDELSTGVTTPPAAAPVGPFASVASEDGSAPSLSGDDPATQRAYSSLPPVTGCVFSSLCPSLAERKRARARRLFPKLTC